MKKKFVSVHTWVTRAPHISVTIVLGRMFLLNKKKSYMVWSWDSSWRFWRCFSQSDEKIQTWHYNPVCWHYLKLLYQVFEQNMYCYSLIGDYSFYWGGWYRKWTWSGVITMSLLKCPLGWLIYSKNELKLSLVLGVKITTIKM